MGVVKFPAKNLVKRDSEQFAGVCRELLDAGLAVRFTASGQSMAPNIFHEDQVVVTPAKEGEVKPGRVILTTGSDGLRVHRMVRNLADAGRAITRGDAGQEDDAPASEIFGIVTEVQRNGKAISLTNPGTAWLHASRTWAQRLRRAASVRLKRAGSLLLPVLFFALASLAWCAAPAQANNVPVTITQTPSVMTVSPGGQITYTDVLKNTNNTASTHDPVITQPIPTNTTFVSYVAPTGFTCTSGAVGSTTSVVCTDSTTFPANGSATLTVTVQVNTGVAGQTVLNANYQPTVTPGADYTVTTVITNTVTVISADLAVTESVSPVSINPGGSLTFTSSITNNGASTAAAPVLTFPIPTNTTYSSYTTSGGITCSGVAVGGTGTLTCTFGASLASGNSATVNVVVAVGAGVALNTTIMGTGTISSTTYDPTPGNNSSSASATVTEADLAVTIVASPASVSAAGLITYTITTTNNGPSAANNPQLVFSTPTNTVFESATPPTGATCSGVTAGNAGTLTCTSTASYPSNTSAMVTITVMVNSGVALGTVITGTATVSSTTYDPVSSNNTASTTTTVAGADLTMSQVTSVSVVDTGINFTYTETATNNGPATVPAGTLVIYQQTPPNTTLQSIAVDANWNCPSPGATGPIICTYAPALASGGTTTADPLVFTLSVNSGTTYGTTILNSATVTSQTYDPVPSNNTSLTSVLVESATEADLALTMTAAPTPVFLSTNLTYTINVQNLGQASAATVSVADTIPAGTTFVSASAPAGWTCTESTPPPTPITVTCALTGTMAEGAAATIAITVTSPSTAGPISNTASITSSTTDPVSTNNSATVITVVQPLVCAKPGNDGAGGTLTGIVNTYYPGTGTLTAGGTASVTVGAASGSTKTIGIGDLVLIMQMQDASINSTNTWSYGNGLPGDPATGATNLQSSGLFEFVTATNAVGATGGTLTFTGTGANGGTLNTYTEAAATATAGQQTFQVIRVPQYTSATLSSGLVPLGWNGSVGGVLAIDVASQVTLGGTVAADALGFRGGGGITLEGTPNGSTETDTDYVVASPTALPVIGAKDAPAGSGADASKGEGIAGTPHWLAPTQSTIVVTSTAVSSGQTVAEGLPGGSFARGAPGNAGGGGTDADPPGNDKNSGGGAGGNGGSGGLGGYGWNSFAAVNSTDGGFGGMAFPASTNAIVMGGGGGAGTTNNGSYWISSTNNGADCGTSCTGVFSSGAPGGGIVIVHTGSVTGTGTITANGQGSLSTLNDSTGGGGAGGSILFYANTGGLTGLTVNANGGSGGLPWQNTAPGGFSGQRHGPGGGGGGGVILLTGTPTAISVAGGVNGYTDTVQDSFGATPGATGITATNETITETPGVQPGAFCATADVSVTNSESPNPVTPGATITYTQGVANAGPFDALNAVFSEAIPSNTTFSAITPPAGWTCNSNASILSTGLVTCTIADFAARALGSFSLTVTVNAGTQFGTQIVDTANITSGTTDPNLANNTAMATAVVGTATSAYLTLTKVALAPTVSAGNNITYTMVVMNNGPAAAPSVAITDTTPTGTTFVSASGTGFVCSGLAVGGAGTETCTLSAALANGSSATLTLVVKVNATGVANGTLIVNTASANSSVANPNPTGATASATVTVASATQADLSIASSAAPNPVYNYGSTNVTFTQVVTNSGPLAFTAGALATYVDTLPNNATFVSLTPPTGWACGAPVTVGSTTTVTCTGPLAVGAMATFPLVEQITAADTAGTVITNSATIGPTASDPNTSNNTASSSTVVAAPSQADLSIVKTATPEPVDQGANLTYTLQVTNNGPAVATGVTVSDPLPTAVTFANVSTSQGTCTQSGGTVSCTLGSISVGGVVIITVNAAATTFSGSGGTVCNTVNGIPYSVCNIATVSATTGDPDSGNNKSEADSTIQSVTAVQLASFRAFLRAQGGVLLEWHTQEEIRNLGFNVYRTDAQGRHQVNPSLIAGAALLVRGGRPQHGAKTYYWIDPAGDANASYELQDVDLNGTRTIHGPATPEAQGQPSYALVRASPSADAAVGSQAGSSATLASAGAAQVSSFSATQGAAFEAGAAQATAQVANAPLLTELNRMAASSMPATDSASTSPTPASGSSTFVPQRMLRVARPTPPTITTGQYRVSLDLQMALKIGVTDEGWYSVTHEQMVAAGFNPGPETQNLQLYAEGVEQPMIVVWRPGSRARGFWGIEFYGTGIDTPFSGTRVYWLVRGTQAGKRVTQVSSPTFGSSTAQDFLATVIEEDRTTYFPTLLNGENNDNFFGAAVTSEPVDQQLTIAHLNANSALSASVDITLQGGTDQQAHSVTVSFNGSPIGEMNFLNQSNVTNSFPIDASLLQEGVNTVTLTALDGDNDVSLVQSIALHYPHTYAVDGDWLKATATPGANLNVTGFANGQISAFDISDPLNIVQLEGNIEQQGSTYAMTLGVPNSGATPHTLLLFSSEQISAPGSLTLHLPDPAIHRQQASDIVVISHPDFVSSLAPLVTLHQAQRRQVTVVTTDQIYDAFNYGERTPFAIQNYLQQLSAEPAQAPHAVLLVGDASLDPRNYLGFGDFDFVPTRIIETQAFKTASDDWFSDFQQTGYGTIPIGRIPVRTAADAALVIGKIVGYESGSSAGAWNQQAVLVADQNSDTNFTNEAAFAAPDVPNALQQTQILTANLDVNTARQQILDAINNGALLVNYTGHGSTEQWSFADLLDDNSAATLSNGDRLPFFLLMDCLNGFFHDVYTESLAESLLLAPNGGAVAVWASSGFTSAPPQATMDQALLQILQNDSATSIGQAALNAKLGISDPDVRRTWILFGDPAMQLQLPPGTKPAANARASAGKRISQGPGNRR